MILTAAQTFPLIPAAELMLILAGAFLLVGLWRSGMFRPSHFADAPLRSGRLTPLDLAMGVGLWLLGPGVAILLYRSLTHTPPTTQPDSANLLAIMLVGQLGMLPAVGVTAILASRQCDGGLRGFGLGLPLNARTLKIALAALLTLTVLVAATNLLVALIAQLLGRPLPELAHEALKPILLSRGPVRLGLILSAVVVAPLLEEVIFRGLVQTALRQSGLLAGRWPVILCASALFAVIHLGAVPPQALVVLFVLAAGLGYLLEKTGSLWPPILVHSLFNAANIALAFATSST